MCDALLKKFFEKERWEKAIEKGVFKDINKSELRLLCAPSTRIALYQAIKDDKYDIAPPHQQLIPKGNGEYRIVYINENFDRIVLSIINDLLFETCKNMVHPACKSYQSGIGCGKVVQEVSKQICKTETDVIGFKADLSKYFDSVPIEYIDAVFNSIEKKIGESKIINVLRRYYHNDWCFDTNGNLIQKYQSLKQGCATASFLADVVLHLIDKYMSGLQGYYVRYSDDILYVGEDYEEAKTALETRLNAMQMKLNPKKVEWLYKDKWFKFLGFFIKGDMITLSPSRVRDFRKEIEKRTIKNPKISETKAVNSVRSFLYKGDGTYSWSTSVLPIINVDKDIDTLNNFVMDCIRACVTGKKKIGGIGVAVDRPDYTILRGRGKNVKANREKTEKEIQGYYSIKCIQNILLTDREVFDTLIRMM